MTVFNFISHLTRMESAFERQNGNHKDFHADVSELCTESSEWKHLEMWRNEKQGLWKNICFPFYSASMYLTCW